jgi:hypothetical protein
VLVAQVGVRQACLPLDFRSMTHGDMPKPHGIEGQVTSMTIEMLNQIIKFAEWSDEYTDNMKMADMQAVIGELARAEIARQQVTSVSSERLEELKNELYYIDQNRGGCRDGLEEGEMNELAQMKDKMNLYLADDENKYYGLELCADEVKILLSLIDSEISRQKTTAPSLEEIQRVTTWMIEMRKTFAPEIYTDSDRLCAAILTALQQYAPKKPCKWCKEVNGFMRLDSVRYSRCDEIGYDHDVQFPRCPNCGRDLKAGE